MNKQLTKKTIGIAASAALMASMALSGSALAGQGNGQGPKGDRDPSSKDCPNLEQMTACSSYVRGQDQDGNDILGGFDPTVDLILARKNPATETFLSRNSEKDADTLVCKTTGAEIKMYDGEHKYGEASALMQQAIDKIHSLYGQGKLSYDGLTALDDAFSDTKACIDALIY